MFGEFRQMSAVLGRRSALRYAGLGVLSALIAGCAGDDEGGGVAARSVEAFAKGRWALTAQGAKCILTVEAGAWRLSDFVEATEGTSPLDAFERGTYTLTAGVLQVQAYRDEDDSSGTPCVGQPIPAEVGDTASAAVQWAYDEERPSSVPIAWDGTNLVLTFENYNGPLVITAVRA